MEPLSGKTKVLADIQKDELMEFDDDSPITFTRFKKKQRHSNSKSKKYIDEESDDDKTDVKCSQETNKDVLYYNKLIDAEAVIDSDDSENNSVDLINDVDECDDSFDEQDAAVNNNEDDEDEFANFIDDGLIDEVATSDENTYD
nr:hypothetical protein [Tanacetum cinerariifolium]